ncbi:oligosaccharide flippase family protein [Thioalkalivibrio nitratireducens]|uniref:oligosaccharide flippase family protein n=1 Tax=Thioalkalivibrio nitratireducens TaxID=186931 RepID=UPI001F38F8A4|nr:oligosaccharide flippase family protein [Thioalkalivibrio nitratireducens]
MIARAKNQIRRLLPKNRFARSVSVLAGGTAAGQIIVVAASPILTRLYTPEDFGLLAVYAALLGIVAVIASLRYQLAIPLPESDEEAASIAVLSLLVIASMTALSALIVWFWGSSVAMLLNVPALEPYMWLLPVGLALMGMYQVFSYWAIRVKAFTKIARTKLTQALSTVGVQLGAFTLGPLALLLGQITGHAAGATTLASLAVRRKWAAFRQVRLTNICSAARRYRRFPIYSTWGAMFNTASAQLPLLLFAFLFSATAAGLYMLAHRVLAMPSSLIGKAIGDVFFSQGADARRKGTLGVLVASIHGKLAHIAMPPMVLLVVAGPELFGIAFGADWRIAGEFARWMAPWIYLQFITSPLSLLFPILEKQMHEVFFQGALLISRLGALLVGAWLGDLMAAVILFSLASTVNYLAVLAWEIRISGNAWHDLYSPSIKSGALSLVLVSPLIIVQWTALPTAFWFAALMLTSAGIAGRYFCLGRAAW